ncbi:MAG TPA: FkbM family methyltransferase [Solirubrobacteraceae bacterium]|nr:FkbM family methyltransferase [Solirubrobacteraceae bacterium]
MRLLNRAVAAASRRLGRPELLAAVNAAARQAQREDVGISAVLACALGGGTYVDVGANRGQVLREAVRVAPHGRHLAFEPIPGLAQELARAFPQVECRQKAIGARAELTEFCHFQRLDGWSGLRRNPRISDARGEPQYITVQVSTLDLELAGMLPRVIKIDVEGAELEVLEGARSVLAQARPVVVFEHVLEAAASYGVRAGAPWDLLAELDYEIFSATGAGPFTRAQFVAGAHVVNWLAAPRGQPAGAD